MCKCKYAPLRLEEKISLRHYHKVVQSKYYTKSLLYEPCFYKFCRYYLSARKDYYTYAYNYNE